MGNEIGNGDEMGLREHEIDFADEIAKRVVAGLQAPARVSNTSMLDDLPTTTAGQIAAGLESVAPDPRPCDGEGCSWCPGCEVCGYPSKLEGAQAATLEQELTVALEQAQALLEETAAALAKARGQRDTLKQQAGAAGKAADDAFRMLFTLTPHSDGQRAMYPLRSEHLTKLRIAQSLMDVLWTTATRMKS